MARDKDNLYGMQLRGNERSMQFVDPYRTIGELSLVEQQKLERHPYEVIGAILDRYSKEGPGAIATHPRGGRAAEVGGHLSAKAGRRRLHAADQGPRRLPDCRPVPGHRCGGRRLRRGTRRHRDAVFGAKYADITTRQSIQLHWIRMEDMPRIWQRFHDVGLTTLQACGDGLRNVLSCPVSGVDAHEAFDGLPIAQQVSAFFTGNRDYANLPRKFKISITGCIEDCAQAEINDIGLWPARADDGTLGFNVLAGGGLSDGERMASDLDIFVAPGPGRRAHPGHRPGLR